MYKILVTGANGQLANAIKKVVSLKAYGFEFLFKTSSQLDITNSDAVLTAFAEGDYQYCINTAAYTNVDGAENDSERADVVNRSGPRNLANACSIHDVILIHISTDFVFDGTKRLPYREEDKRNPISVYGKTKMLGEDEIKACCTKYLIVRTSWLYSEFGHNFFKSMLKLGEERDELSVVFDQIGSPTYAIDLAEVLLLFIRKGVTSFGTYHYSNEGTASWYDFAKAIFDSNDITIRLHPIPTEGYPLPAKRPRYSVMDTSKIRKELQIDIPHWSASLKDANKAINKKEYTSSNSK